MKPIVILAGLASSLVLSGCVAAAAPVVAAGAIGQKGLHHKRSRQPLPTAAASAPPSSAVPASGSVPPGMQYLYGSGEAAAISTQAYLGLADFLQARASDFAVGHPVNSVVLAPDATLAAPKFLTCTSGQRPAVVLDIDETALLNLGYEADDSQRGGPYDQRRWDRWEASGMTAVEPVPGAVEALRSARAAGVAVIFNSNRSAMNAAATSWALTIAGLGPAVHGDTLWLKGDAGSTGSGKDARRWAISARYCVIAMVGDQLGDFSDLFNAADMTPMQRRQAIALPLVRMLWGHGWFVLPNPVYGTGLKGNIDDVFPKNRRWIDPGPPMAVAPTQPPATVPNPTAGAPTPK
ncbi:MAG: acid phosphatase [Sphingomonas sp.]|uniref:5'-nucleotidase, lipoprotein e(P4) family n=1 Tax=Sphingomonas sp. TaxID=28214 RepID=UPI001AD12C04|nr:HAD family acid phosphatase [Sphingomonas sp.]MBN8807063.1 acid phosphatase [Sphingomonas sp.]